MVAGWIFAQNEISFLRRRRYVFYGRASWRAEIQLKLVQCCGQTQNT